MVNTNIEEELDALMRFARMLKEREKETITPEGQPSSETADS